MNGSSDSDDISHTNLSNDNELAMDEYLFRTRLHGDDAVESESKECSDSGPESAGAR
jgi:hypothetical protein